MIYTTLIIDDEQPARERLTMLLSQFPETFKIIGDAKNGEDGKTKIKALNPDLIFLDIEMPGLNGFEMLEQLSTMPIVVFCTAYDEYALQAFETNSIDYLVKPIRLQRLEKTIEKLYLFDKASTQQNILNLIETMALQKATKKMTSITVKKGDALIFIKLEDVLYFEAKDKYISVNTKSGTHLSTQSLVQLEQKLPDYFLRIHRTFIINTNYVKEVHKYFNSRFIIALNDIRNTKITSGRSYNNAIKTWVNM